MPNVTLLTTAPLAAVGFTVTAGGGVSNGLVLSIWIGPKLATALLPALSVAVPFTGEDTPSALKTWFAGHDATPEPESLQV